MNNTNSDQKTIGDDELNIEETKKMEQQQKFIEFKKWSDEKGIITKSIQFPAAFGPSGIPGIAASEDIPENTAILCIPNKLLLHCKKIAQGELVNVFEYYPEHFDLNKNSDSEFNILSLFVLREKIKGKDSDFYPYLNLVEKSYTFYEWSKYQVEQTESEMVLDEYKHFVDDMNDLWKDMSQVLHKFPQFFPKDKITKELFFWAYEFVMTRVFGWSLPSTSLIPFADMMNHGINTATHYVVNKRMEADIEYKHSQYIMKNEKINLQILHIKDLDQSNFNHKYKDQKKEYLKKNLDIIAKTTNKQMTVEQVDALSNEEAKNIICQINSHQVNKKNSSLNLWDCKFFTTTDSEDNDTEEDEKKGRTDQLEKLNKQEQQQIEELRKKWKNEREKLKQQMKKDKEQLDKDNEGFEINPDYQENFIDTSDDEEKETKDVKVQETEQKNTEEKNQAQESVLEEEKKSGVQLKDQGNSDVRQLSDQIKVVSINQLNEENKKTQSKEKSSKKTTIKNEEKNKNKCEEKNIGNDGDDEDEGGEEEEESNEDDGDGENVNQDKDSDSTISDESKWDWFDDDDDDIYFVVVTQQPIKKGEQIFNCYGQRTNKFLLQWYGFAFLNNIYDSYAFRMWMNFKPHKFDKDILDNIIFQKYVYAKNWKEGFQVGNQTVRVNDLTKEFRLKNSQINTELLIFLRVYLMQHYTSLDLGQLMVTIPVSLAYEHYILTFGLQVLNHLQNYIQDDYNLLKDVSINYKQRFAAIFRISQKQILENQVNLFNQALNIVTLMQQGIPLKEAYLTDLENFKDQVKLIAQRHKLKPYLLQLKQGLECKMLKPQIKKNKC